MSEEPGLGKVVLWLIVIVLVIGGLWLFLNILDLSYLSWRTNAETHITRQTNAYLTAHQQALRTMKASYDAIESRLAGLTDADTVDALHAQERGIVRQMHEEADLIPSDIQPDIRAFLSTH